MGALFSDVHSTLELDILSVLPICVLFLDCVLGKLGLKKKTVLSRLFPCVYVCTCLCMYTFVIEVCAHVLMYVEVRGLYQISPNQFPII